jgi:hypothetical protein
MPQSTQSAGRTCQPSTLWSLCRLRAFAFEATQEAADALLARLRWATRYVPRFVSDNDQHATSVSSETGKLRMRRRTRRREVKQEALRTAENLAPTE